MPILGYWLFCVTPQWAGLIGECFDSTCSGYDVTNAKCLVLCPSLEASQFFLSPITYCYIREAAAGNYQQATNTIDYLSYSIKSEGQNSDLNSQLCY